jgi:hypothetical protein
MSEMLANSIVVIAIALSVCYAAWRLGPRKMRDGLRVRLRNALPSVFGHLSDSSGSGCDACGGCAPPTTKDEPAPRKEHGVFWRKSTR